MWFEFNKWYDQLPEPTRLIALLILFVPMITLLSLTDSVGIVVVGIVYFMCMGFGRLWYLTRKN